ncbi:AAA family ATPase [uncultured Thiodictyon sp.]|uniref:nSTAND1 domain-containing NTPase n=1 Tax=uncultured Thiodictyon sp. TaxID=1846217 RepID=UPI0025DC3B06|nr:AAA family ATPase [uncultured Thiodictyon sp.]
MSEQTPLESRIAFARDLAQRGGFGATLAARDAALIIELALRELLRRHLGELPREQRLGVEQAIANAAKGSRAKGLADLTLGQLVGGIRDSDFFDRWSAVTGKPLTGLRLIDLNAVTRFRNKELIHVDSLDRLTDPAAQVSPADAQFLLHCVDLLVTAFGIISLEQLPPTPDAAVVDRLPQPGESPYLGLLAFDAGQRHLFFGREADSDAVLKRLQTQPFFMLLGNSGSGKSSLLAAGILPRLLVADWLTLSIKPGNDLFDTLAAALVPQLYPDPAEQAAQRERLARLLAEPDYRLDHLLQGLITKQPKRRVLLAVDQFEELFTLCADRDRQRRAVELLLYAVRGGEAGAVSLLIVLRADFFGRCLDIDALKQLLDRWPTYNLGTMGRDALRDAIVRPAEYSGVRLEDGLADRILADLGDEPGHLTLLQTALDELWQRSDRRLLTFRGYHAIGGVAEALSRKADDVLKVSSDAGRDILRRIFVQLVRPGEGEEDTRQIATAAQVGAENWDEVSRLANARLVVTGRDAQGQETVELIHEALLRHWPPLRQWIDENRQFRLWQNRLRQELTDWHHHGEDPGALLRGARLVEADDWLHRQGEVLSPPERTCIEASRAEREQAERARRRRQRRLIGGLSLGLVGALSLAGYAWVQRVRAQRASQVATLARGQAEDLINYMLFDLRDKLQPIGRLALLDGVSRKAAEYFEKLPTDRVSVDSERKRAAAIYNSGDVRLAQGDLAGALTAYEVGVAITERLARQDPANAGWQRDLAVSHAKIGLVRQAQGNLTGARESFEKALGIARALYRGYQNAISRSS